MGKELDFNELPIVQGQMNVDPVPSPADSRGNATHSGGDFAYTDASGRRIDANTGRAC